MWEKRRITISENLKKELEELVNDFPVPTIRKHLNGENLISSTSIEFHNAMQYDLEVYRDNQELVKSVLDEWNRFFCTDDIEINYNDIQVMPYTILEVEYDEYTNRLIRRAMNLQHHYLDEIINAGRGPMKNKG